ncbi:MAG: thioredoxin family protein [Actinomycetaceae bacterium]|nr:thioredoxin family protein [Actinomycetaceae bacterium]
MIDGFPVADLDDETWREAVGDTGVVVIEFWAPWCSSCLAQRPIIDQMAAALAGHVRFFRADAGATRIDRYWGVRTLPTVLVLRDGTEVARVSGDATRPRLLEAFARALAPER